MTIVAYGYGRTLADYQFGLGGVGGGDLVISLLAEPIIVLDPDLTLNVDDDNIDVELEPEVEVEVED